MSDPSRGFLADICANVEDDTPRLVYADWLDENGQPERAELIRVQIERTRLPRWDAAQVRLRVREEALIAAHGAAWRAALPKLEGVGWGGFRRGFVAQASLASFALLREPAWSDIAPVEAVAVRWPKKGEADGLEAIPGLRELEMAGRMVAHADADRLATSPLLSTLRVLELKGCSVGVEGMRRVVASPHLGRLEALRAADNGIGDGLADALGAAPALGSLEELDLSESGDAGYYGEDVFTAEGMAELGAWPGLARIRRLNLSGHDFREGQLRPLVRSPRLAGLKELIVENCHNYEGWGAVLEDAPAKIDLDVLDIMGLFREDDARLLAGNKRLRNLKVLRTYDVLQEEESDNIRELASAPFMANLCVLHLQGGVAGPGGLQELFDAAPPLLHTLTVQDAYFRDEHAIGLAQSPATDTLHELALTGRGNDLGLAAAKALGDTKHLRNLLVLRIGGNPMGKKGEDAIAASPLGRRLMLLDRSER